MMASGKNIALFARWLGHEVKLPWTITKRDHHFRFNKSQMKQQTVVLDKFMNSHRDVLKKLLNESPKIVSKGSASRRELDSIGTDKRLITRRMTVLNKLLTQCISDVLATEQIGNNF